MGNRECTVGRGGRVKQQMEEVSVEEVEGIEVASVSVADRCIEAGKSQGRKAWFRSGGESE